MPTRPSRPARDPRVDLLRGLSLLSIFVDHIPQNWLADYTLHNFGFSDAAELFVILAGYSATFAYGRVFDRDGLRVGLRRVFTRCLQIYGVQVALLLATLLFVAQWERIYGTESIILGPMLRDGWHGTVRGVVLRALPSYLDILPLYILLLALFPLIRVGMSRSLPATLAASVGLYGLANVFHWNLPNVVDPADAAHWYFDPFTWQVVFVLGCGLAVATQRRWRVMVSRPWPLVAACWVYAIGAFVALDAWKLWPAPFPADFSGTSPILSIFGNEPKTFVSPWRLLDMLAITYLVLTSPSLVGVSRWSVFRPVLACGRNSLQVFALGCLLALFGRLVFKSYDVTTFTQLLVNGIGLGSMLLFGLSLDAVKSRRAEKRSREVSFDAKQALE